LGDFSAASQLSRLLSGVRAKVNLIPVNPDGDRMVPPSRPFRPL